MNPLNTRFNKASWSAAASAFITLVNGRVSPDIALDATEQGLLMTLVVFFIVVFVPNAEAPGA